MTRILAASFALLCPLEMAAQALPTLRMTGSASDRTDFQQVWDACLQDKPFRDFMVYLAEDRQTIVLKLERSTEAGPARTQSPQLRPELVFDLDDLLAFPASAGAAGIPAWATTRCLVIAHEVREWDVYQYGYRAINPNDRETLNRFWRIAHEGGIRAENDIRMAGGVFELRQVYCRDEPAGSPGAGTLYMTINGHTEVSQWKPGPNLIPGSFRYEPNRNLCSGRPNAKR